MGKIKSIEWKEVDVMTNKGKMIEAVYAALLTQRATLVILYLINRANKELICFPCVKTIAKECNISPRTVQRALKDLEEYGFLIRESRYHPQGGQRSNLLYLQLPQVKKPSIQAVDFTNIKKMDTPKSPVTGSASKRHTLNYIT